METESNGPPIGCIGPVLGGGIPHFPTIFADNGCMELSEFTDAVARMTYEDIHAVKAAIVAHSQSAGDEVDAWRATITIDRALRLSGARRAAAHAAYSASQTVIAAAERARVLVPDPEITAVARSAAELARAIVGGALAAPELQPLMEIWSQYLRRARLVSA